MDNQRPYNTMRRHLQEPWKSVPVRFMTYSSQEGLLGHEALQIHLEELARFGRMERKRKGKLRGQLYQRCKNVLPLKAAWGFPSGSVVKNPPASPGDAGDTGLIPGSGRSPGEGNGNPLQYSCLENSTTEEPGGLQSMRSQRVRHA